MNRNRTITRRLLKKLLRDDRTPVLGLNNMTAYRRSLKGGLEARTVCVQKATEYLSLLKITPETKRPLSPSLNQTVSECRKIAGSIRIAATARMQAIERLLLLEGVDVPRQGDATEQFIYQELGLSAPEPETSTTAQKIRDGARRAALDEVRKNYLLDLSEGRFRGRSASEIAECLRLDGMEPVAIPEDVGERLLRKFKEMELNDALADFKGGK
jgi:hypothetical protein